MSIVGPLVFGIVAGILLAPVIVFLFYLYSKSCEAGSDESYIKSLKLWQGWEKAGNRDIHRRNEIVEQLLSGQITREEFKVEYNKLCG